ncbi:MAG: GntR family transcriptional regulator [Deltaproteobacteria bacterium]|nr:GntR family transcriptional regulator [Deltaproteobacteria bacterium]
MIKSKIKTMPEQIALSLKNDIFKGAFIPGQKLKEKEIAAKYGTSRTPVRESFRVLEREGLISFLPNKGAFVALISKKEVVEIFELRKLIETYCIRKFISTAQPKAFEELGQLFEKMKKALMNGDFSDCLSCSIDFHFFIVNHLSNDSMSNLFNTMRCKIRCAQALLYFNKTRTFYEHIVELHQDLFDSISKREEYCEKILSRHLEDCCEEICENFKLL